MRKLLSSMLDRVECFFLYHTPPSAARTFVRLARGEYAGYVLEMYQRAAQLLAMNRTAGNVAEFGVGSGSTFLYIQASMRKCRDVRERQYFLFDSFEGLPKPVGEDSHSQWKEGTWAYSKEYVAARATRYNVKSSNVHFVKGYYDALGESETKTGLPIKKLALLHIDCDLYSSTRQALDFVAPYVQQGTIVLLDDYFCYSGDLAKGEAAALSEWCDANKIVAVPWQAYAIHGMSFILSVEG